MAKGWRGRSDIDGDIEDRTHDHAHKLALRMGRPLKMKAAKDASPALGMIVLDEINAISSADGKPRRAETFEEKAALVGKRLGLNQDDLRNL